MKIVCVFCDSENVQEQRGVEDVYYCVECDEFFEGDEFELKYLRDTLDKKQHRLMLEQS